MAEIPENGMAAGATARTFLQLKRQEGDASAQPRDYSLNPWTLRFRNPNVELKFATENFARYISIHRLSITMGAIIFALFGVLDYFIVPDILYEAWFIRIGIACPILLGIVALSYAPWFSHKNQFWLSLSMATPAFGVIAMISIADAPGSYLYYAGLIAIIAYINCTWRMSYLYPCAMTVVSLVSYEAVILFINPVPPDIFLNNNAFLALATGVSMFMNYVQELHIRRNFIDAERLRQERERSEQLLQASEAANRAKNDFLAIMSHELRTPLNAIIGFSDIIANEMFGPISHPKYADYASDIRSSGSHLLSIINDILDLSKAEAGKLQLEERPIDPVDSLNQTMRMFRQRAAELEVRLSFRMQGDIPWIIADPRLFNQVAINLTSNALKFTPEGGSVKIELGRNSAGDLEFSVEDTGIGIKEGDISRVFEPFVQVESALSRTQPGTGLGLPLVRKIMALHGGSVDLQSMVGKGTRVVVTFPASRFVAAGAHEEMRWALS
ncbi:sensor histidine kinase [Tepidicaulis sp. LMO-SS28]|uniref:sensor histidine kinase n=1 Tax=Tepidicaulis sp. LMO-SS28 TaxID=3447455 RepID=UPI003EDF8305